jgi:alkylation response protein AidB-like acyl-CoA dehydrogenase
VDFRLTEEQELIRKTARDFAETEIRPHIMEWDEEQIFPRELLAKAGELGFMGVLFPEELGGAGLGYVEYVTVIEELSRVDGSIGLSVAAHNSLCTNHIYMCGNDEQRRRYLPKLASGEWIGAWGLTEPTAGSDAGGTKTTAVQDGEHWVLNGTKTFITHGTYGDACVVIAVTDPDAEKKSRRTSAFVVEKGTPGYRPGRKENKLGLRACETSEIIFEDCRIPAENLIGNRGDGFRDSMRVLDGGRISIAALGLGMAAGAFEASLGYAQERKQFNKPIGAFQAIQWKLADMATEIEAARLLTYRAAALKDEDREVTRESAMAKLYAGETAVRAAEKAVQIFGGYGFVKDYPVEKFYRDVKLCTIGEGTSEIQRLVIARELMKG